MSSQSASALIGLLDPQAFGWPIESHPPTSEDKIVLIIGASYGFGKERGQDPCGKANGTAYALTARLKEASIRGGEGAFETGFFWDNGGGQNIVWDISI